MNEICIRCNGQGTYRGMGFMQTDCELCNDDYLPKAAPSLDKIDRRSKSYQKAINDIMAINKDISRDDAVKMFDDAYNKK